MAHLERIMSRGKPSGRSLTNRDAAIVLGMISRGDRHHDIAAWFGVNQGRIAEVQEGSHGSIAAAPADQLPPKGPPGIKGRRLRAVVGRTLEALTSGEASPEDGMSQLRDALARYDSHEA
ncbi:MAG: hypothetical protein GEU87_18625 [Alphaproteobacteria bacterium]|nr:hypothetical protein [Alphaproteobacteria bacterium]